MESFSKKFDPHVTGTEWQAIRDEEQIKIKEGLFVQSIRNSHVAVGPEKVKSLGYQVYEIKNKLKAEFQSLPQVKIKEIISTGGRENLTEPIRTNILTYTGDTPIDDIWKWNNTKILIHEATFLTKEEQRNLNTHGNRHSNLEEVIENVSEMNVEMLILGHFSSRYSHEEIDNHIRVFCKKMNIKIPVYRVLPGQVHRDILRENPLN